MWLWGQPVFDSILIGGYLVLMTLMWGGLVLGVSRWARDHRLLQPGAPPTGSVPRVSICIPARNEALNIGRCLRAVLAQRWPNLEVIVVDDRSTDDTATVARAAAEGDERLRVIAGSEPPDGWSGKAWACTRAASEACGEILVFVDADVILHPDAVHGAWAAMEARALDLFSAFGTWELDSFWEQVVIPPVGWLIRGSIDLDGVNSPGREAAFANGQFIAIRRPVYDLVDGHTAVKSTILDDVVLARTVQRRGYRLGLVDAPWLFRVRLYRSLREIIGGYSKNLYEGMNRRLTAGVGAIVFISVGTLFPYACLTGGLVARIGFGWTIPASPWLAWFGLICGLQLVFRWRIDHRDGRDPRFFWSHPLGNLVLIWILARSIFRMESEWKGRRFVDGRPVPAGTTPSQSGARQSNER
ncbi:MAG: hypothetical protein CL927_13805 [Deltaproteobacteria bacterium]|nr:hypothetical protein [Deltaproteobacteria bacterium]